MRQCVWCGASCFGIAVCFGMGVVVLLTGCQQPQPPIAAEPPRTQVAVAPQTAGQRFLWEHYQELLRFKDKAKFHVAGFELNSPYYAFRQDLWQRRSDPAFSLRERIAVVSLLNLADEYWRTKGEETAYTQLTRERIQTAFLPESEGVALTRHAELADDATYHRTALVQHAKSAAARTRRTTADR